MQAAKHSTINSAGSIEAAEVKVLISKGGMAMMRRNLRRAFLALAVVEVTEALSVMASMLFHDGTWKSSVDEKTLSLRRTARRGASNPDMATMTLSGKAMVPPMAVTW